MLGGVLETFHAAEVDGGLHVFGVAADRWCLERCRWSRTPHDAGQSLPESELAKHRRVEAMGEVAELLQNLIELFADVVESLCDLWIREFAGQADFDAKCGQVLLRSVMEVALDLAALGVACGHDACTRCAELCVRRLELGRQATVLDGQQQRLTRGSEELRVGVPEPRRA